MSKYYILNKSIILEITEINEYYLIDILGNKIKTNKIEIETSFKLKTSFQLDIKNSTGEKTVEEILSNFSTKLLLVDNNEIKYETLLDNLVQDFQYLELISYQYYIDNSLTAETASVLLSGDRLMDAKSQGNISALKFTEYISDLKSKTSLKKVNALLFQMHLKELFEYVRGSLYHAEHRLKSVNIHMLQILLDNKGKLVKNNDIKLNDHSSDIIGYDIEDTVKSIVSGLDGIGKILAFISKIKDRPDKIKVPNVLHDYIGKYKSQNNPHLSSLKDQYKGMKLLTLMRNDLTHAKTFQAVRQIVFFGRNTECVLKHDLSYVDVLMWDHIQNGYFDRSNEFNDFYSEGNNMVIFLHEYFHKLFELFKVSLNVVKYDLDELCKNNSNLDTSNSAIGYAYQFMGQKVILSELDNFEFGQI